MKVKDGFLLFWRTADYLSNWHLSPFTVNGIEFNCAEQHMMYSKAMLFNDTYVAAQVLKEKVPREQKSLGKTVRNFDNEIWVQHRFDILFEGLFAKFSQNEDLKQKLLSTGELHLVEASPFDTIWGIGMDEHNIHATNPDKWLGLNLLGEVLMKVRAALK